MKTLKELSSVEAFASRTNSTLVAVGIAFATLAAFPATTYADAPCAPPPSGLVSWWRAETNALDQAGGNNGTPAGSASFGSGRVGQAFSFNGVGAAVVVGNPTNLQLQNLTIEAWIKRSSTNVVSLGQNNVGVIFAYGPGGYGLALDPAGQPAFTQVEVGDVRVSAAITDTNFHHLAVTRSASTVVFYVDGVAYPAPAFNLNFVFSTPAAVGARGDTADSFLGRIDELSIYSRALLASEIQAIYNAGSAGKCPPPPPSNCVTPPSGLVSWWKAESNAVDQVGGNSGTLAGNATYGAGRVGSAFVLDGSGDAVPVGNPTNLQLQNLTIEAWIKRASTTRATLDPQGVPEDAGIFDCSWGGYGFILVADGRLEFGKIGYSAVYSTHTVSDTNGFHHVAVTKSGSSIVFYVDGVADAAGPYDPGFEFGGPSAIGARGGDLAGAFLGSIDEISIYNRGLTAAEIQSIYNAGAAGKCPPPPPPQTNCVPAPSGLVSWWKGDGNSLDQTGGNNGTPVGNAAFGSGRVGQAFVFDGNGDGVTVGNPANLQLQTFTIEAWIKRFSTTVVSSGQLGTGVIFGYGAGGYSFVLDSAGNPAITQVEVGDVRVTAPITDTNFHHVAVTRSAGTVIFYVDGVAYPAPDYNPTFAFGTPAAIGFRGDNLGNSFLGAIDEVGVYNRVLSSAEIQAIYAAGGAGKCPPPPATNCAPAPAGLVSWWRGESNAFDQLGKNNGTLVGNAAYGPGEVGQGFVFDGQGSYVSAGAPDSLRFTNNFSIAAWIFPTGPGQNPAEGGTIVDREGEYAIARFADGTIRWAFANQSPGWLWTSSGGLAPANQWTHVAVAYSSGAVSTFINGHLVQSFTGSGLIGDAYPGLNDFRIGGRQAVDSGFAGRIDEVAMFAHAMTSNEVAAIYAAGSAGMCPTSTPPFIITQPASQTVTAGDNASFSVVAGGTQPLSYQWLLNGTNVPGATASSLLLSIIQPPQAGNYKVLVSNAVGSVPSSNAVLVVNPQPPCATPPPGLVSWWRGESNALDQIGTNNGTLAGNTSFGLGRVGRGFAFDGQGDYVSAGSSDSLRFTNNVSIAAWIFPAGPGQNPAEGGTIVNKEGEYTLARFADGSIQWGFANQSPGWLWTSSGGFAPLNQWTHVVLTYGGGLASTFINGHLVQAYPCTGLIGDAYPGLNELRIGGRQAVDSGFAGVIDEVAIFGRAVTSNEVAAIYAAGNAGMCPPPPSTNCVPAPSGLVSWWKAESTAFDQAGGNNGTLVGNTAYGAGRVGQAFVLDGSGDGVAVGNPTNLQLQTFTIEAWVKRSNSSVASLDPWQSGVIFAYAWGGYGFGLWDDGRPFLTKVGYDNISPTFAITDTNTFHHVAITKTGSTVVFFLDGVGQPVGPYTSTFEFGGPAAIGTRGGDYVGSFLGSIDEVSVYNRALAASEIQAIYAANSAGKCVTPSGPVIITQPADKTVTIGSSATFTVVASGTPPLSYQWRFKGTNVAGATGTSYTIANAQPANAGAYSVLVSNAVNSVLSSNAVLTVNPGPSLLKVANASTPSGGTVTVPVLLTANGLENALSFSLSFNTSRLAYASAILANGAGATMFLNESQTAAGKLGVAMALPTGSAYPAGTQELVEVTFTAAFVTSPVSTPISFADQPIVRQVSDALGNVVPATYSGGEVSIAAVVYEADVSPRPSGDKAVTVTDWVLIGRFAARMDSPTNATEFQRADCAPRASLGNGRITVTDWVQAGRYVAGLDPLTPAGGPSSPAPFAVANVKSSGPQPLVSRKVTVGDVTVNQGQSGTVSVSLRAVGNENALGFTLFFDATKLTYTGASLGSAAGAAILNVNTAQAGAGRLGIALALGSGNNFPPGLDQLVNLTFRASTTSSGDAAVGFSDDLVEREVSDTGANSLMADYAGGAVTVNPLPSLRITQTGENISLAWPGWAANFVLQQADVQSLPLSWRTLSAPVAVVNNENVVTLSMRSGTKFYRLLQQ